MFKLNFSFDDSEVSDINYINTALSSLKLADLDIDSVQGYVKITNVYNPHSDTYETNMKFGIDNIELACEPYGNSYTYQIDSHVFAKEDRVDMDMFRAYWCDRHPDRVLCTQIHYIFDRADAYIILHHERAA